MKLDDAENSLIYDWNRIKKFKFRHKRKLELDDETLRDGLQSPSVTDPTIKEKIKLLELMEELKIDTADIGLPGSGPRAQADIRAMVEHISKNKMKSMNSIMPNMMIEMMPHCLEMMLPNVPKEKRKEFVLKMTKALMETCTIGMSEKEKNEFSLKINNKIKNHLSENQR